MSGTSVGRILDLQIFVKHNRGRYLMRARKEFTEE
jgi:hypothetical protein